MGTDAVAVLGFVALFALMLLRVPVGMAMGLVGVCGYGYLVGAGPALKLVGQTSMRTVTDYTFGVIPMFLLMGAFVSASGVSRELFRAANTLVGHLRGGLGIATIGACGGFAAISGSSGCGMCGRPSRSSASSSAGSMAASSPRPRRAAWGRAAPSSSASCAGACRARR